jgi:HAD superfamily hydrolase (TIGR01490 family)
VSEQRPFAVFDIDGTLIRWQLYHAVADELARQGNFDAIAFEKVRQARQTWKQRTSGSSFADYEQTLVNLVDAAISGISVADLEQACRTVMAEYKDQVYTYTRDLLRELKAKNYLLFALSASQSEIVKPLADYYGFDDFGGSEYEVKDGYFTGHKQILKRERKPEYLKQLAAKHHATWQGSIAVGDSESDIPMLMAVEQPIAFNPTRLLFEHAHHHDWNVVVERKNVIYRLEPDHHNYKLRNLE